MPTPHPERSASMGWRPCRVRLEEEAGGPKGEALIKTISWLKEEDEAGGWILGLVSRDVGEATRCEFSFPTH